MIPEQAVEKAIEKAAEAMQNAGVTELYPDDAIILAKAALSAATPFMAAQWSAKEWCFDIDKMPTEGRFEALAAHAEVYRHLPTEAWVIIPKNGRMFVPYAWRPAPVIAD